MQRIRIVTAGAFLLILLFVSGMAGGGAMAQTATSGTPGKPLQLLKIVEHSKPVPKPRVKSVTNKPAANKSVAKSPHKSRVAAKTRTNPHRLAALAKRPHLPIGTVEVPPPPADIPPPVNSLQPANVAAVEPTPLPASNAAAQPPGEVVVAGQKVHVTSPNEVNEIDLAAKDHAVETTDAAPGIDSASPRHDVADTETKADSLTAAPAQPKQSKVGSTSWFLQVMAALGGAVTAGSLAWFLIGSAPQRTYG
jgi:hypothetical protein